MKIGVFSGRFDPPNLGHVLTMQYLLDNYDRLIVPILDYPERSGCSAKDAQRIFQYHFRQFGQFASDFVIQFIINKTHFGKISKLDYEILLESNCINPAETTYLAGNQEVLDHIKSLGIKAEFVPRVMIPGLDPYIFESTKIRNQMKTTGETLGEIYNLKT